MQNPIQIFRCKNLNFFQKKKKKKKKEIICIKLVITLNCCTEKVAFMVFFVKDINQLVFY